LLAEKQPPSSPDRLVTTDSYNFKKFVQNRIVSKLIEYPAKDLNQ